MLKRMFLELHVSDCEAAARFFEHAPGYQRGYTLTDSGQLDFVVMKHPVPGLELTRHRMMPASEASNPRFVRLDFEPRDIHGLCTQLRSKGFRVTDPEQTDYGATTAQLSGPDGYVIWFQQWNGPTSAG